MIDVIIKFTYRKVHMIDVCKNLHIANHAAKAAKVLET